MKRSFQKLSTFLFFLVTIIVLLVFALIQGGFVSWFLFYSFLPITIYYLCILTYPIQYWAIETKLSQTKINAGDHVTLKINIRRKLPFPIVYCIVEQMLPTTMQKKDLRHEKFKYFHHPSSMLVKRQAKQMIFPWFRRKFSLTFTFIHVPRGVHTFSNIRIRIGDYFGFIQKEHIFPTDEQLTVYPARRSVQLSQFETSFNGESAPIHIFRKKHTNVTTGVREYVPGDKFSWIDWNQTARKQQLMTKEFEQEKQTHMMLIFDGTFHEHMNPLAFEGAVELIFALFDEIIKQKDKIQMLSLSGEIVYFLGGHRKYKEKQMREHFARIQPDGEKPLYMMLQKGQKLASYKHVILFITTVCNNDVLKSIELLIPQSKKIIVVFVQAKQLVTRQERKYMNILRSRGVSVHLLTEDQLSVEPLKVM